MKNLNKYIIILITMVMICSIGFGENNLKKDSDMTAKGDNGEDIVDSKYFIFTIPKGWRQIETYMNYESISLQKTEKEGIDIVKVPMKGASDITPHEYKEILENTFTTRPGVEISKIEVREEEMGEVVYVEATTTITEEIMENNIEEGLVTREVIEANGGMEKYKNGLVMEEIGVYYLYGESIVAISGKVSAGGNKSETISTIQYITDNIVIK